MTDQTPSRPAYQLPDSGTLGAAALESLNAVEKANDRLGRVMAVVTAAAMRDILTDFDHSAPFDAARVQLTEGEDGSLFPTGRYWTAAGEERMFADADGLGAIHDIERVDALPERRKPGRVAPALRRAARPAPAADVRPPSRRGSSPPHRLTCTPSDLRVLRSSFAYTGCAMRLAQPV